MVLGLFHSTAPGGIKTGDLWCHQRCGKPGNRDEHLNEPAPPADHERAEAWNATRGLVHERRRFVAREGTAEPTPAVGTKRESPEHVSEAKAYSVSTMEPAVEGSVAPLRRDVR
jgi:hypothetical protein